MNTRIDLGGEKADLAESSSHSDSSVDNRWVREEAGSHEDRKIIMKSGDIEFRIDSANSGVSFSFKGDKETRSELLDLAAQTLGLFRYSFFKIHAFQDGFISLDFGERQVSSYRGAHYNGDVPSDTDPRKLGDDYFGIVLHGIMRSGKDAKPIFEMLRQFMPVEFKFKFNVEYIPLMEHENNDASRGMMEEVMQQTVRDVVHRPFLPSSDKLVNPSLDEGMMQRLHDVRKSIDGELAEHDLNKGKNDWNSDLMSRNIYFMLIQSLVTLREKIGNCGELSILMAFRLAEKGVKEIKVFEIASEHTFLMVGNIICDPWLGKTFSVDEFDQYMNVLSIGLGWEEAALRQSNMVLRHTLQPDAAFRATINYFSKKSHFDEVLTLDEMSVKIEEQQSQVASSSDQAVASTPEPAELDVRRQPVSAALSSSSSSSSVASSASSSASSSREVFDEGRYLSEIKRLVAQYYTNVGVGFFGVKKMPEYVEKIIKSESIKEIGEIAQYAHEHRGKDRIDALHQAYKILSCLVGKPGEPVSSVYERLKDHAISPAPRERPRVGRRQ